MPDPDWERGVRVGPAGEISVRIRPPAGIVIGGSHGSLAISSAEATGLQETLARAVAELGRRGVLVSSADSA